VRAAPRLQRVVNDAMDLIQIYECFCDRTRLRILHLLTKSPLCVCHFQAILGEPQVKVSKHLSYLRRRGMVIATREQNWMIYSLPPRRPAELDKNLRCLQDCVQSDQRFKRDLQKLARLKESCCEPNTVFGKSRKEDKRNVKTKGPVHLRS
jgi:ArsR family transcriptional regulator, arsenate/arsenite/antimonite-responsive transcriptional repressor